MGIMCESPFDPTYDNQWIVTRNVDTFNANGNSVPLIAGTILKAESIDRQTDPDWCTLKYDGHTIYVHNDDIEEWN